MYLKGKPRILIFFFTICLFSPENGVLKSYLIIEEIESGVSIEQQDGGVSESSYFSSKWLKRAVGCSKEVQTLNEGVYFFFKPSSIHLSASFAEAGSEDIDILPSGLAFISSVSIFCATLLLVSIAV